MTKHIIFTKDITFNLDDIKESGSTLIAEQSKVIEALETLRLDYMIRRDVTSYTCNPKWIVNIFKG